MRIAIDVSQIAYKGTGVASYTSELVKHLLREDQKNKYILFGMSLRNQYELNQFFSQVKKINSNTVYKIIPLPQTFGTILGNTLHIFPLEKMIGNIDIYHSSDWIQLPSKARKITTIHDLVIYKFPQTSHPNIIKTQKKRLSWVVKECNIILADSFATKKDIEEILHVAYEKVQVVYPGISEVFTKVSIAQVNRIRRKYRIEGDYILTVGTQEPRKNLKTTLAAFEKIYNNQQVNKKRKLELISVGKLGWGVTNTSTPANVRLLGYIELNDLPALYAGAKCFIYPSLYEGFGMPVLEAFACGCPVITSQEGSLSELGQDTALFVNPLDTDEIARSIVKIVEDDAFRNKLIQSGFQQVKKFQWQKSAQQILEIYNKL